MEKIIKLLSDNKPRTIKEIAGELHTPIRTITDYVINSDCIVEIERIRKGKDTVSLYTLGKKAKVRCKKAEKLKKIRILAENRKNIRSTELIVILNE